MKFILAVVLSSCSLNKASNVYPTFSRPLKAANVQISDNEAIEMQKKFRALTHSYK